MRVQFLRATAAAALLAAMASAWTVGAARADDAPAAGPAPAAATAALSLPDGADEAASLQRMVLPPGPPAALPPALLGRGDAADVTGSILRPARLGEPQPQGAAVPTALPFDDGATTASIPPDGALPAHRDPAPGAPAAALPGPDPVAPAAAPAVAAVPPPGAGLPAGLTGQEGTGASRGAEQPASPGQPAAAAPPAGTPGAPAVAGPAAASPPASGTPAILATPAEPPAGATGLDAAALGDALARFTAAPASTGDTPAQAADRHAQRDAIAAFYAAHGQVPLWIVDGRLSPAGRSLMARIDHAAEDGLDLARFPVASPRGDGTVALSTAELALTEAAVAYARQAGGSRVDVARLGGLIDFRPEVADAARVLGTLSTAPEAGDALQAFNPPQPGYAALRDKLAELRQHNNNGEAVSRIPSGPTLRLGMKDARVPLIRARFGLDVAPVDPGAPKLLYDTQVAAAVADFQRTHGLRASGILTPQTIAALSGGEPSRLEADILANMEMWRWLPRDIAPDRVEVNIPEFQVRVMRDNAVVHETRVVVGQPDKPTPVFTEQMRFIIVNPYWNVPLSIIKKEMMPKLAADPNYFSNHGYEVVERNGTTYVRQPPGDGNALGRIKFMFPNKHAVYLHDTNARSYFARDRRALSHGCVRVEDPFAFAEAVMGRDNGWSEARIKRLIGGQERTINLPRPLPVLITYFTAFVDPQAGFQLRDDVYGYAAKVKGALGLNNRAG